MSVSLVLLTAAVLAFVANTSATGQTVELVAARAKASVAVILVQERDGIASGTGFLVASNRVITAFHVVEHAQRVLLKFPSSVPLEARLVQADRPADVAILEIPKVPKITPLPMGDIRTVHDGETIIVIGYPRVDVLGAQTPTITQGIVSAIRPGALQIQAPVSPGNSGGPVLSLLGKVVGIVRGTLEGEQQAINFATPINAAKSLLSAGSVTRSVIPAPPKNPGAVLGATVFVWNNNRPEVLVDVYMDGTVLCSLYGGGRCGPFSTVSGVHRFTANERAPGQWGRSWSKTVTIRPNEIYGWCIWATNEADARNRMDQCTSWANGQSNP